MTWSVFVVSDIFRPALWDIFSRLGSLRKCHFPVAFIPGYAKAELPKETVVFPPGGFRGYPGATILSLFSGPKRKKQNYKSRGEKLFSLPFPFFQIDALQDVRDIKTSEPRVHHFTFSWIRPNVPRFDSHG